ncbi:hypothetical protein HDU79_006273 [Rhizoclosmatium sp. JEL0117]|nr:hypothetical protein HDU79_006273 [Rhizoclosmatium sp. JEL0117]
MASANPDQAAVLQQVLAEMREIKAELAELRSQRAPLSIAVPVVVAAAAESDAAAAAAEAKTKAHKTTTSTRKRKADVAVQPEPVPVPEHQQHPQQQQEQKTEEPVTAVEPPAKKPRASKKKAASEEPAVPVQLVNADVAKQDPEPVAPAEQVAEKKRGGRAKKVEEKAEPQKMDAPVEPAEEPVAAADEPKDAFAFVEPEPKATAKKGRAAAPRKNAKSAVAAAAVDAPATVESEEAVKVAAPSKKDLKPNDPESGWHFNLPYATDIEAYSKAYKLSDCFVSPEWYPAKTLYYVGPSKTNEYKLKVHYIGYAKEFDEAFALSTDADRALLRPLKEQPTIKDTVAEWDVNAKKPYGVGATATREGDYFIAKK